MKEEKPKIFLYFLLPIGTHHENLTIWKNIPSKYGEFGSLFKL
jgi:hypothetical protein